MIDSKLKMNENIAKRVFKILLERFGEPIVDPKQTVGIQDERSSNKKTYKDGIVDGPWSRPSVVKETHDAECEGCELCDEAIGKKIAKKCVTKNCKDTAYDDSLRGFCKKHHLAFQKKNSDQYFKQKDNLDEVTPPGGEKVVKALKKKKNVKNPWAVAWAMKNKGEKFKK